MSEHTFSELGLPEPLVAGVEALGFEEPSAIQAATIPAALEGRDLVGLSETGSGKTAAFGLPGLAAIDFDLPEPQLLVICPTRELAVQVCGEVQRLGAKLPRLHALAVYGGAPFDRQQRALRHGVHLVVGTPGRLIDHVKRGTLDLSRVRMAVLDEADRMLDMGFVEEMESLLRALPEDRQTLFFSATMNRAVERLIERFGKSPETIQIERKSLTVDSIEQISYEVRQRSKLEAMSRILDLEQPRLALVFCNTKRNVDECTESLLSRGYSADRLHGDIPQHLRERVLRMFREGAVEVLVATDVAARGIDIDDIDLVFNYDLPQDPEDYVHRIGRTGRAGRSGKAVSFLFGRDAYRIKTIERYTRQRIPRGKLPTQEEVEGLLADQLLTSVRERLEAGDFADSEEELASLAEGGHEPGEIAAALLSLLREATTREGEEIAEDRPGAARDRERSRKGGRDRDGDSWEGEGGKGRGPKGNRPPRRELGPPEPGMTRLFLSLGKAQRVKPGDIVGMFHNELGLPSGSVGRITLFPKHSLVDVSEEFAQTAVEEGKRAKLRGKTFVLDFDRRAGGEQ